MAGPSWLFDGNRFANKIKSASGTSDSENVTWKSNPSRSCPSCHYVIDNTDVMQEWPGLPRGVKFDPTDQEIIQHLLAKSGTGNEKPHPFISEFIPTVDEENGICYTHPCNLPGVKQDGNAAHFFHRSIKAYNTGTRKRRKIDGVDASDVRWHKTGRTKPIFVNGVQKGCKKIMVLYENNAKGVKGEKADKTNWVMHQYHLGTQEDEKDGECVISKVFHQQQQVKQNDKSGKEDLGIIDDIVIKVDPVTPKPVTPNPSRDETSDPIEETFLSCLDFAEGDKVGFADEVKPLDSRQPDEDDNIACRTPGDESSDHGYNETGDEENLYLVDSQQLVAGLQLCDDFLLCQSPDRDENVDEISKKRSVLSEYALLGSEVLKEDIEECQKMVLDTSNLDTSNLDQLDSQPEFRLSQLDFCSQESFSAWGGGVKLGEQ